MPEADEQARDLFFELLVQLPGGYFLDPLDVDDVTTLGVPAGYVLSEDDRALARPGAEFASRIGLTPVLVPGGHHRCSPARTRWPRHCSPAHFPANMRFASASSASEDSGGRGRRAARMGTGIGVPDRERPPSCRLSDSITAYQGAFRSIGPGVA